MGLVIIIFTTVLMLVYLLPTDKKAPLKKNGALIRRVAKF